MLLAGVLCRCCWQVYKATWKEVTMVAVKVIGGAASEELDSSEEQRDPEKAFESFCKEALIMCSLRDKNIVQFLGASLMVRPQNPKLQPLNPKQNAMHPPFGKGLRKLLYDCLLAFLPRGRRDQCVYAGVSFSMHASLMVGPHMQCIPRQDLTCAIANLILNTMPPYRPLLAPCLCHYTEVLPIGLGCI